MKLYRIMGMAEVARIDSTQKESSNILMGNLKPEVDFCCELLWTLREKKNRFVYCEQ